MIAVIEYLTIQKFLEDTTLITHEKTPDDSSIIDLVKEEITCLVLHLTLDYHKSNAQLYLHHKIVSDTDIYFNKQATTKTTDATAQ